MTNTIISESYVITTYNYTQIKVFFLRVLNACLFRSNSFHLCSIFDMIPKLALKNLLIRLKVILSLHNLVVTPCGIPPGNLVRNLM